MQSSIYNHIRGLQTCHVTVVQQHGGAEEVNEYVLRFIACTQAFWQETPQVFICHIIERTGEGLILSLIKLILGRIMCRTSSTEMVSKSIKPFEGCSLVDLDAMPIYQGNFRSISDALKSLLTEPTFTCRYIYSSGSTQTNTFNVIFTSNNNTINLTQMNKERYVVLIDCKTKELFECYYRQTKGRTSKYKLGKYIKQLGIRTVMDVKNEAKRYFNYVISAPDLLQAYEWIDEEVDLTDDDSDDIAIDD